jgi:cell division protein FtsB
MTSDQIYKAYCDQLIQIENLQKEIARLQERNEKLSKRNPTKEEALAQYEWLKANSKRNKETE